jgi:hypothetical protein
MWKSFAAAVTLIAPLSASLLAEAPTADTAGEVLQTTSAANPRGPRARGARRQRIEQLLRDRHAQRQQARGNRLAASNQMVPQTASLMAVPDEDVNTDEGDVHFLPVEPIDGGPAKCLPEDYENAETVPFWPCELAPLPLWEGTNGDEGCIVYEGGIVDDGGIVFEDGLSGEPGDGPWLETQILTLGSVRGNGSDTASEAGGQGRGWLRSAAAARLDHIRSGAHDQTTAGNQTAAGNAPTVDRGRDPGDLPLADRRLAQRLAEIDHLRDRALLNGNERLLETADRLEELARRQYENRTPEEETTDTESPAGATP